MANHWRPANRFTIALLIRDGIGSNCNNITDNFPDNKMGKFKATDLVQGIQWLIRWGTTSSVPAFIDKDKIINKSKAIHETSNKGKFRLKAHAAGLTAKTWATLADLQADADGCEAVVIRPVNHERSQNINLCRTLEEAEAAIASINGEYYISEYIQKDEEYRVFIGQGKAFMVWKKIPRDRNAVSWGCVEQGQFKLVDWSDWPLAVVENAIKSFNLSALDFGAVDVMVKEGTPYFLEINTAPEVWPYYGQKFAQVFGWMTTKGKDRFATNDFSNWKKLIHPALTDKAIV